MSGQIRKTNLSFLKSVCTVLMLTVFTACDAPRNNPLDPGNPDNNYHYLSGSVQTLSLPRRPLASAELNWLPDGQLLLTDASGKFDIETIGQKNGWLRCKRDGYISDSVFVHWNGRRESVTFFLNQVPIVDTAAVYSVTINRYPDLQQQRLGIQAGLTDADNDVDSVHVFLSSPRLRKYLTFNPNSGLYEISLNPSDFGLANLAALIGKPFLLQVTDKFNHFFELPLSNLQRIITEEVDLEFPVNDAVTGSQPEFRWKSFTPGFRLHFRIEVFTREIDPQLVWSLEPIPSDTTSVTPGQPIPTNQTDQFFWVLWAIDEYGNRTRSKTASFIVQI